MDENMNAKSEINVNFDLNIYFAFTTHGDWSSRYGYGSAHWHKQIYLIKIMSLIVLSFGCAFRCVEINCEIALFGFGLWKMRIQEACIVRIPKFAVTFSSRPSLPPPPSMNNVHILHLCDKRMIQNDNLRSGRLKGQQKTTEN